MNDNKSIMPKVSVIVPVYNVEKYLRRCVDSILAQTFTDFEVLLIDDGSTDSSGKICDEFQKTHGCIKAFHQSNMGVTAARQRGVKSSKGEWITFVDSDDSITVDYLNLLYGKAKSGLYDIIVGNSNFEGVLDVATARKYCILGRCLRTELWAHLFKSSLFDDGFVFDIPSTITKGEDMLMNIRLAFMTEKPFYVMRNIIYKYELNESGTMKNFKESLAYEDEYRKYKYASVPKDEFLRYAPDLVFSRANFIRNFAVSSGCDFHWKNSNYLQSLKSDIKKYKCSLPYSLHLIIYGNRVCLLLFIYLSKLKTFLHDS